MREDLHARSYVEDARLCILYYEFESSPYERAGERLGVRVFERRMGDERYSRQMIYDLIFRYRLFHCYTLPL